MGARTVLSAPDFADERAFLGVLRAGAPYREDTLHCTRTRCHVSPAWSYVYLSARSAGPYMTDDGAPGGPTHEKSDDALRVRY